MPKRGYINCAEAMERLRSGAAVEYHLAHGGMDGHIYITGDPGRLITRNTFEALCRRGLTIAERKDWVCRIWRLSK